jgi:hypothetical protein
MRDFCLGEPNQPLEPNRRPASLLDSGWKLGRAFHAQAGVSGGGR